MGETYTNQDLLQVIVKGLTLQQIKAEIKRFSRVDPNTPDERLADITVGEWLASLQNECYNRQPAR